MAELSSPASSFIDLLAGRREAEAAQFVREHTARVPLLRSIYAGIYEAGLEEACRRRVRGDLTAAQGEFVAQAMERVMSVTAPALMARQPTRGAVLCASFGSENRCPRLAIAAALLMLEGYDVCYPSAESSLEDLERIIDEVEPALYVFSASSSRPGPALARLVAFIRAKSMADRPFIIAFTAASAARSSWKRLDIDLLAERATQAVEAALQARADASRREA